MEANLMLRARLSTAASTVLEDVDVANQSLLSSIDCKILCRTTFILVEKEIP